MSVTIEHPHVAAGQGLVVRAEGVRVAGLACGMGEMRVRGGAVLMSWQFRWHVAAGEAAALLRSVCRSGASRVVLVGAPDRVVRAFCMVAGLVGFDIEVADRLPAAWWLDSVAA